MGSDRVLGVSEEMMCCNLCRPLNDVANQNISPNYDDLIGDKKREIQSRVKCN